MNIESLVRPNIRILKAFSSARSEFSGKADIWLDANENPFDNGLNRYPDPFQSELKKAIGLRKGFSKDQIFIGNGSDEIIDLLIRVFCIPGKDSLAYMDPSFSMYRVMADANDIKKIVVPLDKDFDLDVQGFAQEEVINAKIIFLCSPNNPVGNLLSRDRVLDVIRKSNGLVVIDEAYIDFTSSPSYIELIKEYNNVVVLQTLSKAYGAAGLRIGMCFASAEVISFLNKIKTPYNVGSLVQREALNILSAEDERQRQIALILSERERLVAALEDLPIVERVFPSETNFIMARFKNHDKVLSNLLENGIVVRDRSKERGCEGCLRITIGQIHENDKLLKLLQ